MALRKPVMRGLLEAWTKKHMTFLLLGSSGIGAAYYVLVGLRRKKAYADFYKNYDDEKAFNDMVKLGIFKSYNAKGQPNPEVFE